MTYAIRHLVPGDAAILFELLQVFAESFEYTPDQVATLPELPYLARLLEKSDFIALAAIGDGEKVCGGLTAYELVMTTSTSKELYLYDLAVRSESRRLGIATALIDSLRGIASKRDVTTIFVESELEDEGAVAFYASLNSVEQLDVKHFNINVGN